MQNGRDQTEDEMELGWGKEPEEDRSGRDVGRLKRRRRWNKEEGLKESKEETEWGKGGGKERYPGLR